MSGVTNPEPGWRANIRFGLDTFGTGLEDALGEVQDSDVLELLRVARIAKELIDNCLSPIASGGKIDWSLVPGGQNGASYRIVMSIAKLREPGQRS